MAFRLYLLDNWLQSGIIDIKEYRRRQMFAVARDMSSPDEDQEARAKRVADAIRMGAMVPELRWQDNEAIHHLNPQGNHIGGLTGFLKSVGSVIRHVEPTRVILVF